MPVHEPGEAIAALREEHQRLLDATKDRWPGPPASEADRIARLLIAVFEEHEPRVGTATVATFVDMARMVVGDTQAQVRDAHASSGLVLCMNHLANTANTAEPASSVERHGGANA